MRKFTIPSIVHGAILLGASGAAAHPGHEVSAVGTAQAQRDQPPPPHVAFVADHQPTPFNLFRGNRIFVPAAINGHHTGVMLDTGASITAIDRDYAKSIGLPPGQPIGGHGPGGDVSAELVSDVTLDVGGVRFEKMNVAVMDLKPIGHGIGRPINAVLGRDFFNAAVISIDWARNELRIRSSEAYKPDAGVQPIELARRGPFNTISVSVAGAPPVQALFDLGNSNALVMPATYWHGRPEVANLRYAGTVVGGVGGVHPARAVTVPSVALGGMTFPAVPAVMSELGNDSDPAQMTNVGIGLLKQFKVDLDLGHDRVYLAPRADTPAFERDRAGVRFDMLGDRLKVQFISPHGPAAAAGLKIGDEIVAVDGRRVTSAYYDVPDWTRGAAGDTVVLTRADGSKVNVTLADYY